MLESKLDVNKKVQMSFFDIVQEGNNTLVSTVTRILSFVHASVSQTCNDKVKG